MIEEQTFKHSYFNFNKIIYLVINEKKLCNEIVKENTVDRKVASGERKRITKYDWLWHAESFRVPVDLRRLMMMMMKVLSFYSQTV